MKVLLVGASGTIGQAIQQELAPDCEIVTANSSSGDVQVDLSKSESIAKMYDAVGAVDAVICAAARGVKYGDVSELSRQDFVESSASKLYGQIDLVLQGIPYLNPNGSFTLTTGILNIDPIVGSSAASMVNAGVEGFLLAASNDLKDGKRINVVSPALLEESLDKYRDFFPGYPTVPASEVALAFRKSLFGNQTGQVYRVGRSFV